MNPRGRALQAAGDGKLRDSYEEGYSAAWPYVRPGDAELGWWNGFLYSSWQLLGLKEALDDYEFLSRGRRDAADPQRLAAQRRRTLALCALSLPQLPRILGRESWPAGTDHEAAWRFRHEVDVRDLLKIAGFDPTQLWSEAETLLWTAGTRDPMQEWWPLMRHANYAGWSKLKGTPLDCLWMRIAAEILLRTHEELSERGELPPLPDISGQMLRHALHDRISPPPGADSLDSALVDVGLSPHPRVLLLLEGQTEMAHVPKLLAELGLEQPHRVRVQNCHSSEVNPQLISRYAVAPRLGPKRGDVQTLDRPPTALIVAMDPENRWATEVKRQDERRKLQRALREEVQEQGGTITREDLDYLVDVRVWGEDSYEIANFTDDELVRGLLALGSEQGHPDAAVSDWQSELRTAVSQARSDHRDLWSTVGPLRIRENKPRLAALLWPDLLAKYERELQAGTVTTPVLCLVEDVRRLVAELSLGSYVLRS